MAKCDEGYLCRICLQPVEMMEESLLYLQYVLHQIPLDQLHIQPECHIRCSPETAQYIVDDDFPPVSCSGFFDKSQLDPGFVREEEARVTAGWKRLRAVIAEGLPLPLYPLPKNPP
jgi:hypothetical protein